MSAKKYEVVPRYENGEAVAWDVWSDRVQVADHWRGDWHDTFDNEPDAIALRDKLAAEEQTPSKPLPCVEMPRGQMVLRGTPYQIGWALIDQVTGPAIAGALVNLAREDEQELLLYGSLAAVFAMASHRLGVHKATRILRGLMTAVDTMPEAVKAHYQAPH